MCDVLRGLSNAIASVRWLEVLEVVKALAPVVTAGIAFVALKNWQRQDKAKREAEFLDLLVEATHAYIAQMPTPITLLKIAKIGMKSHERAWEGGDQAVKGAIAYIEANGERDAKRLREALNAVQPSLIRLRSLAAKGQIFKFPGYSECYRAVAQFGSQFDKIEALMTVIASPTWNWENPDVLQLLMKVMAIDADEVRTTLQANNIAVLEFCGNTYRTLYG